MRTRFAACAFLGLILVSTAGVSAPAAGDPAPPTAGAFAIYCQGHSDGCQQRISMVDLDLRDASPACRIPHGVSDDDAMSAVLAWLDRHPETRDLPTDGGVGRAIRDLWSCVPAVTGPSAKTSSGAPMNTAAFLAYCPKFADRCNNSISVIYLASAASASGGAHCDPPDSVDVPTLGQSVRHWLAGHPETHAMTIDDSALIAIDHIWPCH